ncbi:MAG: bifunctional diaminohydroxyphosphoribosylaminopyrimidine deaminase/5-amino-6-(5-phosphoribosylamino)uracil reductase RibD [Actinomycetota bacterium]
MDEYGSQMLLALELAARGWGRVSPNPMVGAVVLRDHAVVGEGWHEGPGTAHAEVMALAEAGDRARGATVVCTLEPCDHTGRTGPCTLALIEAGVARVVVGAGDPNPVVDGAGVARLRAAGVDVVSGVLADECHRLNEAYDRHVTTGRPFVTLKMASSLDGKTAAIDGSSKWITGEAAREDVQRLRAGADAIVVGAGTARDDDPSLTVRVPEWADARPPLRVVVDTAGRVPAEGHLFDGSAPTLVATSDLAAQDHLDAWGDAGAEVLVLDRDVAGGVSLDALLAALGKRDVQGVLVEGGATLAWSLVRDGLVDKVVQYLAPLLIGGARAPGVIAGGGFAPIANALRLDVAAVDRVGEDLRVEAYVHRDR